MIQKLIGFVSKNQKYFTIGGACILLVLNSQQRTKIQSLQHDLNVAQMVQGGDIVKDSLINENDSLRLELFNAQNQNGRYEMGMEYLYEINPKAGKEFEEYINNNTE